MGPAARPVGLLLALFLLLGAVAARAEPPVGTLDAKARVLRRSELRSAAGKWITHRQRFPSPCPVCKGTGADPRVRGARACPTCKAKGAWISPPDYRAVYYDMRTEAFKRLPGIQDALEAQYKEANQGLPWPTRIGRYRISEWELVDETHGIVWFLYGAARSPTATHWIWSTQAKAKGEWCSYDSRSDGTWPVEAGEPAQEWEPVPASQLPTLRAAVANAETTFTIRFDPEELASARHSIHGA